MKGFKIGKASWRYFQLTFQLPRSFAEQVFGGIRYQVLQVEGAAYVRLTDNEIVQSFSTWLSAVLRKMRHNPPHVRHSSVSPVVP